MSDIPKVVIGLYTGKYVSGSFPSDVGAMVASLCEHNAFAGLEWAESCRVDSNRNRLIFDFLHKSKGTHLFIVDEDMHHPPDMPFFLASRGLPIVSGLYFRRGNNGMYTPQFYRLLGKSADTREGHGQAVNNFYEPMMKEVAMFFGGLEEVPYHNQPLILTNKDGSIGTDGVFEIDGGGFGCLMISREALEAMEEPYLRDEPGLNGDLVFYKQAKEKSIPVYGDCHMIASHNHNDPIGLASFYDFTTAFIKDGQHDAKLLEEAHNVVARLQ